MLVSSDKHQHLSCATLCGVQHFGVSNTWAAVGACWCPTTNMLVSNTLWCATLWCLTLSYVSIRQCQTPKCSVRHQSVAAVGACWCPTTNMLVSNTLWSATTNTNTLVCLTHSCSTQTHCVIQSPMLDFVSMCLSRDFVVCNDKHQHFVVCNTLVCLTLWCV